MLPSLNEFFFFFNRYKMNKGKGVVSDSTNDISEFTKKTYDMDLCLLMILCLMRQ